MKIYYVYLLLCNDKTYYTGVVNNIIRRLREHQSGVSENSYTCKRLPVQLVWYCEFTDLNTAIEIEKKIKKWSQIKKKALVDGVYEELPNLSKKKFDT